MAEQTDDKQLSVFNANPGTLVNASVNEKLMFLRKMGEYVGAETIDVNSILNVPIKVRGVVLHEATINQGEKLVPATGELVTNYIQAERTVFKLNDGKTLGFVSISIASFVRQYFEPLFGLGDWVDEQGNPIDIDIKVTQVEAKGGRAYNIKVL